ncbi:MAG: DUF4279 domain-containing protein [Rhizobiales bacterium]|nr:DUF4279 domain-containing protein [Hyphomicrobiales bacterium]
MQFVRVEEHEFLERAELHTQGSNDNEDTRRFDVQLFIVHPTIDPASITAALGLKADNVQNVGEQRQTPRGALLLGKYRDTRWRHSVRFTVGHQHFAQEITNLIDRLEPHRAFLKSIQQTGGTSTLIVKFLGDGYFGDDVPIDALARMANLGLALGIECYVVPQS